MTTRLDGGPGSGGAALWRTARTLLDVGEPMSRWLEGDITYQPGYGGDGPDPETDQLVAALAAVNRAGYVTTFSQPGEIVEDWYQRAAVDGFCDEATATRIYDGVLETEVIPLVWQPGSVSELHQIPVSREVTRQNTWCGHPCDADNIDYYWGPDLHPECPRCPPPSVPGGPHRSRLGPRRPVVAIAHERAGPGQRGAVPGPRVAGMSRERAVRVAVVSPDGRTARGGSG